MDKEAALLKKRIAVLEKQLKERTAELEKKSRLLAVETALEKVSTRTISMRNSSELSETSAILFQQLKTLGIDAIRSGVGIFDDPNDAMELWLTTVSNSDEVIRILDYFSLHVHPVFENIIPARKLKKPFSLTVLKGQEVREYYQTMSTYLSVTQTQVYHPEEYLYSFFFSHGTLYVITTKALTTEECDIMIQFTQVFGLIYLRFLDLQTAESQAREALQQAALEGVRAEIASMSTADDLSHITPLIWKELAKLSVPFFRCGVFVIDEKEQLVKAYLSTPEGEALAVLNLAFDDTEIARNLVANWRQQQVYSEQWDRDQFQQWVKEMLAQGQIHEIEQYQAGDEPPEFLSLHFVPFTQGMLYVGSRGYLDESHIDIVQSLAESFSVAYARYDDFKQLEAAKYRVEAAFAELKATQSQLIQSEKMASLGELTAGIAHEIKNPLNFVNNFSEVNRELLLEMKEALENGNWEEAKALAADVISNEEKIVHHGKRADGIVKGMLQHSRISNGQKEPTDINVLADEYLRLAYHGLRAKDKSFTATMKTDFDENTGNINIVPQDIGRVILNLITNAFYAVTEKSDAAEAIEEDAYVPTVTVGTRKVKDKIIISVKDNGNGIPEKVRDKIFQPFFTTKPTGQGTGLGLSMSYDIVTKGHGGELQLETEEGKGTEFRIVLPYK
jgi:signal transduction histidine kinase